MTVNYKFFKKRLKKHNFLYHCDRNDFKNYLVYKSDLFYTNSSSYDIPECIILDTLCNN